MRSPVHHQSSRPFAATGSAFRPAARGRTGGHCPPLTARLPRREEGEGGDAVRDAQTGVPSAGRPRAQLAFKDSMVHGILQFTPSIAFRYVLHRCESRDIRCRESFCFLETTRRRRPSRGPGGAGRASVRGPWRGPRRGSLGPGRVRPPYLVFRESSPRRQGCLRTGARVCLLVQVSTMILPQVHLRKPCYDFSFL